MNRRGFRIYSCLLNVSAEELVAHVWKKTKKTKNNSNTDLEILFQRLIIVFESPHSPCVSIYCTQGDSCFANRYNSCG